MIQFQKYDKIAQPHKVSRLIQFNVLYFTSSSYLNGLQVPLHPGEFALQRHHSSQVIAQALSGFNHFGLFLHPSLDLITLQVVVLDIKGRFQVLFLLTSQLLKLFPSGESRKHFMLNGTRTSC